MADFINLTSIAERIKLIFAESGMNASDFCRESGGIPSSTFSQIINDSIKVNVTTINRIIERWGDTYPPLWILLGDEANKYSTQPTEAPPYKKDENSPTNQTQSVEIKSLIEEISALRTTLSASQTREIDKITIFYSDKNYETYRRSDD